ncbi:MAG TPA: flagellar hook protein FlgE [Bacillota bacterium]|nr:flagellar hook protein FlgE [Bacillota bacterium]
MQAAVSGLQMHQMAMDAIGNNIANVSTPGYKSSTVDFAELFTQTLQGATAPTPTSGGIAPAQIGLGVGLGGIDVNTTQGSLQVTGNNLDLAIQGDGYFVLKNGAGQQVYSRVGNFSIDASGHLVQKGTGDLVLGWAATNGTVPSTSSQPTSLTIPLDTTVVPTATTGISFAGNLNALTASGTTVVVAEQVYDSLGNTQTVNLTFTATATPGSWTWSAGTSPTFTGVGTITFSSSGAYTGVTGATITSAATMADGATSMTITPDFSAMTEYAQANTAAAPTQNGSAAGSLQTETVDQNGVVTGSFTNGKTEALGQVAMAAFANPSGLLQTSDGLMMQSNDSGTAQIGSANSAGRGQIQPGSLEGSNVDLSTEFADMIQIERGYEANAKVITTANQMLQTLNQMVQ